MHNELRLGQELFKLALLIGFFVGLVEVEPSSSTSGSPYSRFVGSLSSEARLDDLLDLVDPGLLEEVAGLRDARGLNLVEFVYLHRLGDVGVVHILHSHFIALLTDLLLSANDLIFDLEGLAAVLGEGFWEVVRGDGDHAVVGSILRLGSFR